MKIKLILCFAIILLIASTSALTEEERIRNNRMIEDGFADEVESVGIVGVIDQEGNFEINPFIIFGIFIAIIFLIYFVIKIVLEKERI